MDIDPGCGQNDEPEDIDLGRKPMDIDPAGSTSSNPKDIDLGADSANSRKGHDQQNKVDFDRNEKEFEYGPDIPGKRGCKPGQIDRTLRRLRGQKNGSKSDRQKRELELEAEFKQ